MSDRRPSTTSDLVRWDREHVWHAFTQMQDYDPLLIERGQGATLYDTAGNAYLDGSASMWCNVHGHRHPRLDAALRAQLAKVAHTTNLGLSNPTTVELARRLVEIAPPGLEKVFFTGDGSSAIEAALKTLRRLRSPAEDQARGHGGVRELRDSIPQRADSGEP